MFFHADVPLVDHLLGHTTLYEERRGDFAIARKEAEQHLAEAHSRSDARRLTDALLACGIVYLLQGDTRAARASFEEADREAAGDSSQQLRARAYTYQAILLDRNYFPNGGAASAQEVQEVGADAFLASLLSSPSHNLQEVLTLVSDPALLLEYRLLNQRQLVMLARQAIYTMSFNVPIRQQLATGFRRFREAVEAEGAQPHLLAALDIQLADLLFGAGHREPALEVLRRAQSSYERLSDLIGMANSLMKLGDWKAAPFGPPEVWNTALAEGSPSNALRWEIESIEFDTSYLDVEGAHAHYEQAHGLYREASATRGLAAVELRYGYLAMLEGSASANSGQFFRRAAQHAFSAYGLYLSAGDQMGAQVARTHYALHQVGNGHHPEDQATAEEIGTWGHTEGSFSFSLGLGLLFARIGRRWLVRDGDYERALNCFRLSGAVFRGLGAKLSEARSLTDQSIVYKMLGERNAFVVTAEQALYLCETVIRERPALSGPGWKQASWVTGDLMQMANSRADADGIVRLAARMQKLLPLLPGLKGGPLTNESTGLDEVFALLAEGMAGEADPEQATLLAASQMALFWIEKAKFLEPLYCGRQALSEGDEAKAQIKFELAQEAARTSRTSSRDREQMEAMVLSYQRRSAEAAAMYHHYLEQERLAIERLELPPELQRDRMRQFHKQALTFFIRNKSYSKAQTHLKELTALDGQSWWKLDGPAWDNLSLAGELSEGLNCLEDALDFYGQAMEIFEQHRYQLTSDELKTALASDSNTQHLYFQAARTALKTREAAVERGDADGAREGIARAFQAIERGKARSLLDLMAGGALLGSSAVDNPSLRRWRHLTAYLATRRGLLAHEHNQEQPDPQRIEALSREVANTERQLDLLEADLSALSPQLYRAQIVTSQVLGLDAVAAALPADTALLQYAFLGEDLLAWAITDQGPAYIHRVTLPENTLKHKIRKFHGACESRRAASELGEELADILLTPFDQTIADYARLLIVPYGAAHLLPFQALPWRGEPLAAAHTITYLPSASIIQFMRLDVTPSLRVLAVGNPTSMSYQESGVVAPLLLPELPAAELEAIYVASLFPGSKALIREQATVALVRADLESYSVLHFATHGRLSAEVPLLSAILLAGGEALSVYEMMGLRLHADLVVLSACRTGQGDTTPGDDILGLTRALLAAGARAALVSLWPVDDVATSILMGEFYRCLRKGEAPPAALQAAQDYLRTSSRDVLRTELDGLKSSLEQRGLARSTVEPIERGLEWLTRDIEVEPTIQGCDYSHPFYWAPFILVGM